jgi:hypothetical protein
MTCGLTGEGEEKDESVRGDGGAALEAVAAGAIPGDPGSGELLLGAGGGDGEPDRGSGGGSGRGRSAGAEEDPEEDPEEDQQGASRGGEWIPLVVSPGDPRWQEIVEEEQDLRR